MKVKFGMMMTDGRGKLGGQVASKNRAGAYVRTKVTPVNPRTQSQMQSRSLLGQMSTQWSGLTEVQRNAWNGAVDDWQSTDIFGDLRKPTGKNLYTKLNVNLSLVGSPVINEPPTKIASPIIISVLPNFSTATSILKVDANIDLGTLGAGDWRVVVQATPAVSPGTFFVGNKFRDITNFAIIDGLNSLDITSFYEAKFGVYVANTKVYVRLNFIASETGQTLMSEQALVVNI